MIHQQKCEKALNPLTVREYNVGGTKYIVNAIVKDTVTEDAVANDPCTCGNGKKFKKCCFDKTVY